MGTVRQFWARVSSGRWKVINSATGKIVGSHWTRTTAQDVSSNLNETLQYVHSKNCYVVRWM